jgi:hypothetical protein
LLEISETGAGASATDGGPAGLAVVLRADVIDGVQAVLLTAAPLAALAVLALVQVPPKTVDPPPRDRADRGRGPKLGRAPAPSQTR